MRYSLFLPQNKECSHVRQSPPLLCHTRYCAILDALKQLMPHAKGHLAQHLVTLAALMGGIVGSKSTQLPAVATKIPGDAKRQSRITTLERWLKHKNVTVETFYVPYVHALLASVCPRAARQRMSTRCSPAYVHALLANLPAGPLVLVMDASQVGRGCMALVVRVIYKKRALPLGWLVVNAKKGHLPQDLHCQLFHKAQRLLGDTREVIFLGDGEFDGTDLLAALEQAGWQYVCRTASNVCLYEDEAEFRFTDLGLQRGHYVEIENVAFTQAKYSGVTAVAVWKAAYAEPLYLVTNLQLGQEAVYYYQQRFCIETFFSDQKSRGFHLADSHLRDPARVERLLIASCLAYVWMICLGVLVKATGQVGVVHRKKRCDLSLFQLGLLWLEHCLNEGLTLWVAFRLPPVRQPSFSVG